MPSHRTVIDRWLDTLERRRHPSGRRMENLAGSNVFGSGRTLYSYGTHFPLAEYHPAGGRSGRRRPLFLLNGDRVSVSTARHQSDTRAAIGARASSFGAAGADVIILPFSALESAGIIRDSVIPLEIRPDRNVTIERRTVAIDLADVSTADAIEDTHTDEWRIYIPGAGGPGFGPYSRPMRRYTWRRDGYTFSRSHVAGCELGEPRVSEWPDGEPRDLETYSDGRCELIRQAHRLGDSLFTARVHVSRRRRRPCTVADVIRAARAQLENERRAEYESRRDPHRRPVGLFRTLDLLDTDAPIVETERATVRRRFISSFDMNEPAPLYFLATLPNRSRARTVEMAIEDLAPPAVHAAMARGRDVRRQGDIFAIETDLADADMQGWPRARLTQWTRSARPDVGELGYVAPLRAADRRRQIALARAEWRRRRRAAEPAGPVTQSGARRRFAELERKRAAELESVRLAGRSAILRGGLDTATDYVAGYRSDSGEWIPSRYVPRAVIRGAETSRSRMATIRARGDSNGFRTVAHSRDRYRRPFGESQSRALDLWRDCLRWALERMRPNLRPARRDSYRARLRETLSVHGTAHSATEVARGPGGRVYVRGIMRHVPDLDSGRRDSRRDHVPTKLGDGSRWYLAVRNTVPRAR